ncbi:hypothetical protein GCM10010129_74760 [Streptomyces fumigatiscleroticus]|nr:hypothetical protein GCM10010129_74760 [Streptomyces fumigatiscleroticus]
MDMSRLSETTAGRAADHDPGRALAPEDVRSVLDAVLGTVEHPGTIAEALRNGETVVLGSFGSFRPDGGTASFRPGRALEEFLQGATG